MSVSCDDQMLVPRMPYKSVVQVFRQLGKILAGYHDTFLRFDRRQRPENLHRSLKFSMK